LYIFKFNINNLNPKIFDENTLCYVIKLKSGWMFSYTQTKGSDINKQKINYMFDIMKFAVI